MENTKKLLSIILCFVILLSVAVTSIVNADTIPELDKTKPYIEAVSEPVEAGEIAKVTYSLGNNPGIWGIRLELEYADELSLVTGETNQYGTFPKFDVGQNFEHGLFSPLSSSDLVYLYTNSTGNIVSNNKNGDLFTLYFKVADNAKAGTYAINIVNYKKDDIIDINSKGVEFTFGNAYVTVKGNDVEESSSSTTTSTSASVTSSSSSTSTSTSSSSSSSSSTSSSSSSSSSSSTGVSSSSSSSSSSSTSVSSSSSTTTIPALKTTASTISTTTAPATTNVVNSNTKIITAKPVINLVKSKKTITVKLKNKVDNANGYQIKYSTNKKLKKATVKNIKANKKLVIKKVKSKKTYYVRIRAYSVVNGSKVYSKWSATKKIKIK